MIIIVYSETTEHNIRERLGYAEYSYYFVLKEFLPVLRELGIVVRVSHPETEVDAIYHSAARHGQTCIFLSFSAPQATAVDLDCPTIPVFAWEFEKIPDEIFEGERRNDWRYVFRKIGRAITHSNFAVAAVKAQMGADFPVTAIPAPVWDRFSALAQKLRHEPVPPSVDFDLTGLVIDPREIDIFEFSPQRIPDPRTEEWPHLRPPGPVTLRIPTGGVVYTSIFNPYDGRKNWFDMMSAFVWALRDREDATLIIKATYHDPSAIFGIMTENLYKLTPYKCRIVLVHAFLDDADYERLFAVTTYAVNTSHGEGQCLPLMEYMSGGKPAIAPMNSSMTDYIDENNAFLVRCTREPGYWPHDPRLAFRTLRSRIDFESLVEAYRESYRVATEEPQRYARMSEHATATLERHCSEAVVAGRLRTVLGIAPQVGDANEHRRQDRQPRLVPLS